MVRKRGIVGFLHFVLVLYSYGSPSRINTSDFPEDLGTLCPYTSFCDENATQNIQTKTGYLPCCQQCSCDSTCGLYNNCCYKHLDIYKIEETYQMVCRSSIVIGKSPLPTHYRMINKCLRTKLTTPVSPQIGKFDFYPVFSRMTGFIYFNVAIAHCNQARDTVPFRKVITCSSAKHYISDAARLIRGEEPETDCFLQFLGPRGVDLKSELCEPNVIRKCSFNENSDKSDDLSTFCEAFNATFIYQKPWNILWYGNIYCFLCNEPLHNNEYYSPICSAPGDYPGGSKVGKMSMMAILDTRIQPNNVSRKITITGENKCPVNMAMIKSLSTRCRQVECPTGKIRLNDKCHYHSELWVGGPFVVLFRLISAQADIKIPISVFKEMSEKDRNDGKANWLRRRSMRNWRFLTLYHPSPDNNFTIDFIVTKAIYPSRSVDPNIIEKTVRRTLGDTWQIRHKNETIGLKIALNNYITYEIIRFGSGIFANDELAYIPDVLFHSDFKKEFLHQISKFRPITLQDGMFFTQLFFCEQVELFAEEFDDHSYSIFFKVKNITLFPLRYRRVEVVHSSETQYFVRVCLSEFQLENNFESFERIMLCKVCMMFVLIHSLTQFV